MRRLLKRLKDKDRITEDEYNIILKKLKELKEQQEEVSKMTKIDRIHIDVTYGTTVYQLISTLQEVADYDGNATVGLDSADEINFDVNKPKELKENG